MILLYVAGGLMSAPKALPLVVIVGPTASGKTGVAIELAERYRGEIICADSRTVYKGLDIGTAKPTPEEQGRVPHWGIDLVDPDERFTVVDFKRYAGKKIDEIRRRGHIPFLVGGTGLYVDAVLYNFQFPTQRSDIQRSELNLWSMDRLIKYCKLNNVELPTNLKNRRHLVAAIMRNGDEPKRRTTPIADSIIVGITTEKIVLEARIKKRATQIWESDIEEEALRISTLFGWSNEAMTGNIYPIVRAVIQGELTRSKAVEQFIVSDRQLAKRQMTWFRRNNHIKWLPLDQVYTYCARLLAPDGH